MKKGSEPSEILVQLVAKAIELGVDELEVERKDGQERVFAFRGSLGLGIASFPSSSEEATWLRKQLYKIGKKGKRIEVFGVTYRLTVSVFDSFGDDAFWVQIREA